MDYVAKVKEYDPNADEERVKRLERRLALVLNKRDTASVAASDPKEVERAAAWVAKACSVPLDEAKRAVDGALETMKNERMKNRLVVYYLSASSLGKLADL
ncbi:DUF2853 family protein [Aurantimonas sp. VKM B-3413]|uniref:DUF2853 family protein n=1 Tax=Aurantimonas sp. VKM B-3413 TaxID=2779401 RepID=UPI001E620B5D|nr:DUF2853 family protein [Aurantimonas sp. VKM B-3413]MCB8835882.1 DUF2853 family protein [Aurantimonas sp. VKM B-3413]